jgi:hypothetical protein
MANLYVKPFLLLVALFATSCYDPGILPEEDDLMPKYPAARMVRRYAAIPELTGALDPPQNNPYPVQPNTNSWGQHRIEPGPWRLNERRPILRLDKMGVNRVPQVQNIVLSANPVNFVAAGGSLFRWELTVGCGGGNTTFILDAGGLQQLSVSAEQITLSLFASNLGAFLSNGGVSNFTEPQYSMDVVVYFADGNTNTEAPTFTEYFDLTAAGGATDTINVPVPDGANGFRLLGSPASATTPFAATVAYSLVDLSGVAIDRWTGDVINGIRSTYIPVNSLMQTLQIVNTGVVPVTPGVIEWAFDL